MKHFLIKNPTDDNVSAKVTVNPSTELSSHGDEAAATMVDGNALLTCLSPADEIAEHDKSATDLIDFSENGSYAVEIDGVVVPHAFTTPQLMQYFNGVNDASGVLFQKEPPIKISCVGANPTTELYVEGVWDIEIDGEIVASDMSKDEVMNFINATNFKN